MVKVSEPTWSLLINSKNPAVQACCYCSIRGHMQDNSFILAGLKWILCQNNNFFCICENLYSRKITNLAIHEILYSRNNQELKGTKFAKVSTREN